MDLAELLQYCRVNAPLIGGFLIANQLLFPAMGALMSVFQDNNIEVEDIEIQGLESVVEELDVRDFVNLANSLAYQHGKMHHVCRHYAVTTADVYQRLIEKWDRADLSGAVRLVGIDDKSQNGHMWLEILEGGEWTPYESFNGTPRLSGAIVKDYSMRTKKRKSRINDVGNPWEDTDFRSIPGKRFMLPTKRSIFSPAGATGFVLRRLKYMFKEH